MKTIAKSILTLGVILLVSKNSISATDTEKVDLDLLCNKFPLNSRCQNEDYSLTKQKLKNHKLERDTFCQKFSLNSHCQEEPVETIDLNLARTGEEDEWIRIRKKDRTVYLVHSTRTSDELISTIVDEAVGLIPIPDVIDLLPFDPIPFDTNKYNWNDHQVIQVSFKSDRCKTDSCVVTGKKSLDLPKETDLYEGLFTIKYKEENLERSVSFRVDEDAEVRTVDTIIIGVPEDT